HLPTAVEARQQNAARYRKLFSDAGLIGDDQIVLPACDPHAFHVWNQYTIRVGQGRRDGLKAYLSEQGIGTEIYYPIPMHRQTCLESLAVKRDGRPETEAACAEVLTLPIYPELRVDEQQRVVEAISRYYAKAVRRAA